MSQNSSKLDTVISNIFLSGIALIPILSGLLLLWWGESQSTRYGSLGEEAARTVVEMKDVSKIDPALDGKLVHAVGQAECETELKDPVLGVSVKGFCLERSVEYYQLTERQEKRKDSSGRLKESYKYKEEWTAVPVPFDDFYDLSRRKKAKAPIVTLPFFHEKAKKVRVGAYALSDFLISSVEANRTQKPNRTAEQKRALPNKLKTAENLVHVTEDGVYIGSDPTVPHLGDARITFKFAAPSEVSIVAQVQGNTLEMYHRDKDPDNVFIGLIVKGNVPAQQMLKDLKRNVAGGGWLARLAGMLLVVPGCFFLPWKSLMQRRYVRTVINGPGSRSTEWQHFGVVRFAFALLLFTSGLTRLFNGSFIIGVTVLALAAAMLFLPCIMPNNKQETFAD